MFYFYFYKTWCCVLVSIQIFEYFRGRIFESTFPNESQALRIYALCLVYVLWASLAEIKVWLIIIDWLIDPRPITRSKASGRLPIRHNWRFFAISYGWDVISGNCRSRRVSKGWVTLLANFRRKGASTANHYWYQKNQWRREGVCRPGQTSV